jgi:quercetin dioxygenase-like cupin family protein
MSAQNLKDKIAYSPDGVTSKVLFKTEQLNVTLFCMAAGTEIGAHTSTRSALVHVLEGEGTFTVKGERIAMAPGVLFSMPAKAEHSIAVSKNTSFLLVLS